MICALCYITDNRVTMTAGRQSLPSLLYTRGKRVGERCKLHACYENMHVTVMHDEYYTQVFATCMLHAGSHTCHVNAA